MDKYFLYLLLFCSILFSCSKNDPSKQDDSEEQVQPELFKANRLLIKHGLQLQCWLATDNFEMGSQYQQPAFILNHDDWKLTGFTGPTFYGPPLINTSFFTTFSNSQWSIAKAPYGDQMKRGPHPEEKENGFLTNNHKNYLDRLVTACFGDEEYYSSYVIQHMKEWFSLTRKHYPEVLVHNNQYAGQWSEAQMRYYIAYAKPDIITYDWYYFHSWDDPNYKGARDMAKDLALYRQLALGGLSGDGNDYIAFGQYTQGFVNEGTYKLTESQMRLYYYMTWTFGGKWLNWFRYLQGDGYGGQTNPTPWSLLLEEGIPGNPSIHMQWANKCNSESKYIGGYLVRLKTSDVFYIPGSNKYTEGAPSNVYNFNPNSGYLSEIKGSIISDEMESADLYLGYFNIIPTFENGDPDFFDNSEAKFFMITNAYASKTEMLAEPLSQKVKIKVKPDDIAGKKMFRINPDTGIKEELGKIDGIVDEYEVVIKGGSGQLFMIES